ncbi:hypothetical protein VP1G_11466 [Cytospora mali]|uniref:Uncharacterized protein n=1 Tax=Cytospora mali TaxID=578113 RepID=A0A194VG56_CYTMA|nr:hypothetical protein VP1G_11466 [Valsa mali var. pyri (nom. inval.)]
MTQPDEVGLRQAMWSNHCGHAFDDFVVPPSGEHSLTGNVNSTFNPFRQDSSIYDGNEDVDMVL